MTTKKLIELSQKDIVKGSKSFSLASFFFNRRQRQGSWLLYSWCRYVDDQIDLAPNSQVALIRLEDLGAMTLKSERHEWMEIPAMRSLQLLVHEYKIPIQYPLDLLRGMRMDVEGRHYETLQDLEDYCYCVAGVVGLMMCHVMGVSNQKALAHAVSLGKAMQMTNICRDIEEDYKMGRIYLPAQWLRQEGLSFENFALPMNRMKWFQLSYRLLLEADQKYQTGLEGLQYLPFRAAWAVGIAARFYSRIGYKVLARKELAWDQRCHVGLLEKMVLLIQTTVKISYYFKSRLFRKWKETPIDMTWSSS